jgi:RND family efflux transporter MFP subunit
MSTNRDRLSELPTHAAGIRVRTASDATANFRRLCTLARCLLLLPLLFSLEAGAQQTSAPGITEPFLDSTLSAAAAGIVGARRFKEGDAIKQGDVLVELDKRLEELDVMRRKAVHEQAKNEFEITKALFEKANSSTPRVDVEKRQLEYEVSRVEHDLAREQLRRRHITAPFDGVIAEIFLQVGEACQLQQPVVRIVDTRRCHFVSNVEAKAGRSLKSGQQVSLEIDTGGTPVRLAGIISFVSPVVDPASGLLKVKVVFDNPDGAIRPGVAGRMTF